MKFKREFEKSVPETLTEEQKIDTEIKEIKEQTVYIDIDKIKPNSKNEYEMSQIEQLSEMIKLAGGIWQNIIVLPERDGFYTITTGERRWRAAKLLQERGLYPEKFEGKVPCTIRQIDDIDLPLDKEMKETFAILVTNQYRTKTDGERMMEMKKWREIIASLRKRGVEYLPSGFQNEGMKIKGTPTRGLIAEQLGVSTGQVSRMESVEKNASPQVLKMLIENQMDLGVAEELVQVDKRKQDTIIRQLEKNRKVGEELVTKADVKEKVAKKLDKISIEKATIEAEFVRIQNNMKNSILLTDIEYKNYQSILKKLEKILC